MPRAPLFALVVLATLACTQNPAKEAPDLDDALRLEVQLASYPLRAVSPVEARFTLRNVSSEPAAFCQVDGGVSVALLRYDNPDPQPIVLHGAHNTRAGCHGETMLNPGAAKEFRETLRVRRDLTGPARILAHIRVRDPGWPSEVLTIRAQPLVVVIHPR